jgi:hypothetical protein
MLNVEEPGIALGYRLGDRGFESREGLGIFLLITASRPALEPTHSPAEWVPGALFLGVKRVAHEAHHIKKKAQGQLYLYLFEECGPI